MPKLSCDINDLRKPSTTPNRPFRVFLSSGSSQRLTVARPWIERLAATGIEAYDWTRDSNWDLGRMPTEDELIQSAQRDEHAVQACDLFWYVVPDEKSEGAASELALARHLGKRIVISGPVGARNIFALLVPKEARYQAHEEAFAKIVSIANDFAIYHGEF
jgi:hypothetical protein